VLFVVTYDISDDKLRAQVADILEGVGERVQESVFECRLTVTRRKRLVARLGSLPESVDGSIRFYPLCDICRAGAFGLGHASIAKGAEPSVSIG
jgi:CRISPR-associated protein Cas2